MEWPSFSFAINSQASEEVVAEAVWADQSCQTSPTLHEVSSGASRPQMENLGFLHSPIVIFCRYAMYLSHGL